jgi:hypothetical protein
VLLAHPIALQLRNLQVLGEIAAEHNSTIVFPAQFLDSIRSLNAFVGGEERAMTFHDIPAVTAVPAPEQAVDQPAEAAFGDSGGTGPTATDAGS